MKPIQTLHFLLISTFPLAASHPEQGEMPLLAHLGLFPENSYLHTLSLSDSEFQQAHEKLRDQIGEENLLALRRAEMDIKMKQIVEQLVGTECFSDGAQDDDEFDEQGDVRIFRGERQFRVGKNGAPAEAVMAWYEALHVEEEGDGEFEIPVEMLAFEVPAEEIAREEEEERVEFERREAEWRADVLSGKLSVRDLGNPCECQKKKVAV